VVTYGAPFYAGWGLTEDHAELPRRSRRLQLDELVAAALLLYPRYWDARSGGFVECETILHRLVEQRRANAAALAPGGFRRQIRKWQSFFKGLWQAALLRGGAGGGRRH